MAEKQLGRSARWVVDAVVRIAQESENRSTKSERVFQSATFDILASRTRRFSCPGSQSARCHFSTGFSPIVHDVADDKAAEAV